MKRSLLAVGLVAVIAGACAIAAEMSSQSDAKQAPATMKSAAAPAMNPRLKTEEDQVSYAFGLQMGENIKRQQLSINPNLFSEGFKDGLSGGKPLLSTDQAQKILAAYQQKLLQKQEAKLKVQAEKNAKDGAAFLANNKKEKGVVTLPSGLQYKVLTKGKGAQPTLKDTVTVNYEGTLINGTVFDSSYKRGKPISFPISAVIKGWQEALPMMHQGATWQLYIPANLAYGPTGVPGIGPNETLIFKVNLISIDKKTSQAGLNSSGKTTKN